MDENHLARRLVLKKAGALGAAGALAALTTTDIVHADQERSGTIVGTWLETIKPTDTSVPSFQALTNYAVDGGWISTASTDLTPATLASSAYGTWVRAGERSYRLFARAFAYTPQGIPDGLYTIQETLHMDETGRRYSGSGSFEIVNNGILLVSGTVKSTATRVSGSLSA